MEIVVHILLGALLPCIYLFIYLIFVLFKEVLKAVMCYFCA